MTGASRAGFDQPDAVGDPAELVILGEDHPESRFVIQFIPGRTANGNQQGKVAVVDGSAQCRCNAHLGRYSHEYQMGNSLAPQPRIEVVAVVGAESRFVDDGFEIKWRQLRDNVGSGSPLQEKAPQRTWGTYDAIANGPKRVEVRAI